MKSQIKLWSLLAAATVIAAGYIVLGFIPMRSGVERVSEAIANTEKEMDESISNIRRIPVLLARRDQSRTAVEKLRQKILIPDSISQAVSQFNRLCESYKIKLRSVNFSTDTLLIKNREAGSNESFDLPVLLEFEGRYLDAGMLMERSGDLGFIINFTDFNVTAQERSEKLKFQIRACLRVAVSRNVNGVRR